MKLSLIPLILNASIMVQFVLLLLLSASVVSWMLIFERIHFFRQARLALDTFEQRFWAESELSTLFTQISKQSEISGLAALFYTGFKEFVRLEQQVGVKGPALMQGVERRMRVSLARETNRLEAHLGFLATVGSVSPYIGLFGTVWGIMHAFMALGQVQQASLAMVAPGIAEALIATAMGLFAAIPAVIAYNRLVHNVDFFIYRYEIFKDEFASILHREAH